MISFELTEEQKSLQEKYQALARDFIKDHSLAVDDNEPGVIDKSYLKIISELNHYIVPEEYGGKAKDRLTLALMIEEISYGCASLASIFAANVHAISALLIGGSEDHKQNYLPGLLDPRGEVASCVITEEKGGSDTSYFNTTARLQGERYILNGKKGPIFNAGNASFYIVFASTGEGRGRADINAFLVPRESEGLNFSSFHSKTGLRGAPTADIYFNDVYVSRSNLIGLTGGGYLLLMQTLDLGRAFFGAICVGLAKRALEEAKDFARNRQIKEKPVIENQGVNFLLAELETEMEASRLLVWKACRLMDLGEDYSKESSMAKMYAAKTALRAASEGMQLLGQESSIKPSLMDKYQRDAQTLRIVEGTEQIQKIIIASQI